MKFVRNLNVIYYILRYIRVIVGQIQIQEFYCNMRALNGRLSVARAFYRYLNFHGGVFIETFIYFPFHSHTLYIQALNL